jgi:drug/metabolite transporter (DMT)-like permease
MENCATRCARGEKMIRRRTTLVILLLIIGVMLVYLPYRIHFADSAADLRSHLLGILLPLGSFTAAALVALSAPERVRSIK